MASHRPDEDLVDLYNEANPWCRWFAWHPVWLTPQSEGRPRRRACGRLVMRRRERLAGRGIITRYAEPVEIALGLHKAPLDWDAVVWPSPVPSVQEGGVDRRIEDDLERRREARRQRRRNLRP